jgi:hypothetical protein
MESSLTLMRAFWLAATLACAGCLFAHSGALGQTPPGMDPLEQATIGNFRMLLTQYEQRGQELEAARAAAIAKAAWWSSYVNGLERSRKR